MEYSITLQIEMNIRKIYVLLICPLLITIVHTNCIEFDKGECTRCLYNHKLIDGECYQQIIGCLQYINPTTCGKCNSSMSYLYEKYCVLYENYRHSSISALNINITLHKLAFYDGFYSISMREAQQDYNFQTCNKYLRAGQYKHFLSKSQKSYIYVGVSYKQDNWNCYKAIYEGSGGGLLLSFIDINTKSLSIIIKSIVSIGRSYVKPYCKDYNVNSQCILCQEDYHLQNGLCIKNIQGCIAYYGNICLRCRYYMMLIENRCVSNCMQMADLGKIPFYHRRSIRQITLSK